MPSVVTNAERVFNNTIYEIDIVPPKARMATKTEVGYRMIVDTSWHLS